VFACKIGLHFIHGILFLAKVYLYPVARRCTMIIMLILVYLIVGILYRYWGINMYAGIGHGQYGSSYYGGMYRSIGGMCGQMQRIFMQGIFQRRYVNRHLCGYRTAAAKAKAVEGKVQREKRKANEQFFHSKNQFSVVGVLSELALAPIIHTITQPNKNGVVTRMVQGCKMATTAQTAAVTAKPFTAILWVLLRIKRNDMGQR
jgi:hypothetical protein